MTRLGEKIREGSIWQRNVAELLSSIGEGWIASLDTWTYASATTITVPSGAGSKYAVGDKIRLVQTSTKYFVIVGVADSLLTITGGTDYTLANATITDPYYSHAASPMGYPNRFAYTPTATGFGGSPPTMTGLFSVIGRRCFVTILTSANGTSTGTGFTLTAPIAASHAAFSGGNYGFDNGVLQEKIRASIAAAGTTITLLADGAAAWTNVNAKGANVNLEYPI